MSWELPPINDLYCFAEVVAHGGFAQAGRALRQPKSKLSRRIAQLEKRLGVRLLEPSTRRFRVTKVGQAFYERCRGVVAEAETRRASQIPTIWSCGAQAPRKGRRRIMRQHGRTGSKIDLAHNFKIHTARSKVGKRPSRRRHWRPDEALVCEHPRLAGSRRGNLSRGPTAIAFVSLIIPTSLNRASASDLNLRLGGFVRQKGVQSKPTKPQDALLLREPHLDFLAHERLVEAIGDANHLATSRADLA